MDENKKITDSIFAINPIAQFTFKDNNLDTIEWCGGTAPISKADIEAKMVELQAEYDAEVWKRDRLKEYPPIGDQLDMIYHDIDNWKSEVKKIKDANPKETE